MSDTQMETNSFSCFKAYDIRGEVGKDLDNSIVYWIGRSFAQVVHAQKVVIGRDNRQSSLSLTNSIIDGLLDEGVQVLDLGLCGTEEMYFGTSHFDADGGIQVTASHNPVNFNGMKLVGPGSRPLEIETEFKKIKGICQGGLINPKSNSGSYDEIGRVSRDAYIKKILSLVNLTNVKEFTVLVNFGNGAAGPTFDEINKQLKENGILINFIKVNEEPDGTFPNGVPNPLLSENHSFTGQQVINTGADLGIAFDGDFDRCFFFDNKGDFINGEYIVGLLAEYFLEKKKGSHIVHDYRVIWSIRDCISRMEGTSILCDTGHVYIKEAMRKNNAIYGGEISGHHYFKDFFCCDSGMIPWLLVLKILTKKKKKMSAIIAQQAKKVVSSGEQNFMVNDIEKTLKRVESHLGVGGVKSNYNDGLSLSGSNWRFNIRASKTEKLLRLNIESRGGTKIIEEKLKELTSLINFP